ncbi:hypothetical protein R1flu_010284 [Riccia fluitans]|uniref:Fungal-type protein kinase domain-containing protein n=1 Tax=Riccia fluitans TaxID=41844 RepID=A0ABD1Z7K8_9MARC
MRGYERNYDFGDLLDCASGLNRLAVLEYGEEVVKLSKAHVKQRPLWVKLNPLPPGHEKPDLFDFARLATDDQITKALKVGLQQAQTLLTQLNMSPHAGMRDKTWWRTPWTLEKELGIFGTSSSTQELDHDRFELNEVEEVEEMPNSELSFDLWDIPEAIGAPSTMEADEDAEGDETNDLEVYRHEARHVMSETMSTLLMEHAPINRKVNPMVSYEGHEMHYTLTFIYIEVCLSLRELNRPAVLMHYVLEDIFLWGITNTNAEGDRLLVKDTRDGTNVMGWNEIAVIFGVKHNEKEDFQSIKVMHTTLDKYNPRSYFPTSVETNPNKKLVSGQRYEEILYYKDAAPYGLTYHLMTIVAELFWSAGRSNRFLTPMILAYLRGLHGHSYNWAKAILQGNEGYRYEPGSTPLEVS